MDLWQPYKNLAKTYFPNAKIVVDKFHYIRYAVQAVDTVRNEVQKNLTAEDSVKLINSAQKTQKYKVFE